MFGAVVVDVSFCRCENLAKVIDCFSGVCIVYVQFAWYLSREKGWVMGDREKKNGRPFIFMIVIEPFEQ